MSGNIAIDALERAWPDLNLDEREVLLDACFDVLEWTPATPNIHTLVSSLRHADDYSRREIAMTADRLVMGRRQYGALDLASDPRDWEEQEREERVDGRVYKHCGRIKAQRAGKRGA